MVVGRLHLGVLICDLVEGPVPEVSREGQHVGLVDERQVAAAGHRQVERVADDPLHPVAGVDRSLRGDLVRRAAAEEAPLTGVGTLGVLAHDPEVDVASRVHEGSKVHVEVEGEAHLEQQAPLDQPRRHLRGSDGPQVEGVQGAPLLDHLVRKHGAVTPVAGTTQVVVDGFQLDSGRSDHLEALGDHIGPDAIAADDAYAVGHD